MRVSRGVEWALHTVMLLAQAPAGSWTSRRTIADFYDLPDPYLAKYLKRLVSASILLAVTGPRGGYRLAAPPEKISALSVFEAIEGSGPAFVCEEIRCHGTGAAEGTKPETCPDCHGTGQVQKAQRTPLGNFMTSRPCSRCGGTGQVVKNPCKKCGGTGHTRVSRKIEVKIPAGIDEGQRVRISGGGEAGQRGGPNGDLYVYIYVKHHKLFKRSGADVISEVPISFVQAALGDTIEVPTIDGKAELKIPAGIQSGTVLRMRGKGIPHLRGTGRGDQHVRVKVLTPQKLTSKQKDALQAFGDLCGESVNPEQKTFKDTLKSFFK